MSASAGCVLRLSSSLLRVALGPLGAVVDAEIDVSKRELRLAQEPLRVVRDVGLQLRVRGLGVGDLRRYELHLLPQAPPDDHVVLVETHREGFPVEDLVADVVGDQALGLAGARRAPPDALERFLQAGDLAGRDDDLARRLAAAFVGEAVEAEEDAAEHDEMEERLAQELHHACLSPACTRSATCRPAPGRTSAPRAAS